MLQEKMLYNTMKVISELNKVKGFDPREYLKKMISPLTGEETYDLELKHRKLWLRLKYPEARVNVIPIKVNEQTAIFEARVYFSMENEEFASNYVAKTTRDVDGSAFIQKAQYIAVDQAVTDAGFGCQFIDVRDEFSPKITTTENEIPLHTVEQEINPEANNKTEKNDDSLPENFIELPADFKGPFDEEKSENDATQNESKEDTVGNEKQIASNQSAIKTVKSVSTSQTSHFTPDMSVDEILSIITVDEAESIVTDNGTFAGKTLGQIANERIAVLKLYSGGHASTNRVVQAAAMKILAARSEAAA